jgi:two-component system, LytTR family, response regulator
MHTTEGINTIIIDDNINFLKHLTELLLDHCPECNISGAFENPKNAYALILRNKPELLFLDVEMPELDGFQLLDKLKENGYCPIVIFTTVFEQFAFRAFKYQAIDYLLKPIEKEDLRAAIGKVIEKRAQIAAGDEPRVTNARNSQKKICLPTSDGLSIFDLKEILYFEADQCYTTLKLINGSEQVFSKSLAFYENILLQHPFLRTHRKFLVNILNIQGYSSKEEEIILSGDYRIPVSKRKKSEVFNIVKSFWL